MKFSLSRAIWLLSIKMKKGADRLEQRPVFSLDCVHPRPPGSWLGISVTLSEIRAVECDKENCSGVERVNALALDRSAVVQLQLAGSAARR